MPKQIEKLQIFLASPGDVSAERKYVTEIVQELNISFAPSHGVVLEVIRWETHTFPGYGKDAQAIVNEQIAMMAEYDLFVGIMWNRLGTPTPRADSGTVEEFDRAAEALKRKGQPQIWFYFRDAPANLTSDDQLDQKKKVQAFKRRVQKKGMTWPYKRPQDFRDEFRRQVMLWLESRKAQPSQGKPSSVAESSHITTTTLKPPKAAPAKVVQSDVLPSSAISRKLPTSTSPKSTTPLATRAVTSSGTWVLLGDRFYISTSVTTQPDGLITVTIAAKNGDDEAALRSLHPDTPYHNAQVISYAHLNFAAQVKIESALPHSQSGKVSFTVKLQPQKRSRNMEWGMMNGVSAGEINKMRARLILLNEQPKVPKNDFNTIGHHVSGGHDAQMKVSQGVFVELWPSLSREGQVFLMKARLLAVHKMILSGTVDDVLELKLGPITGTKLPVIFRGQRRSEYTNEPSTPVEVEGTCQLPSLAEK